MKMSKRIFSILLCICLCVTLMPVFPASAYDTQQGDGVAIVRGDTVAADWIGSVITFSKESESLVKLTIGAQNVAFKTIAIRLQYNLEDVALVNAADKSIDITDTTSTLGANAKKRAQNAIEFCAIKDNLFESSQVGDLSGTTFGPEEGGANLFQQIITGNTQSSIFYVEKENAAEVSITSTLNFQIDSDTIGCFDTGVIQSDGLLTLSEDKGVVDIYNLYFRVKDGAEIDGDTFTLYSQSSAPNGAATGTDVLTSHGAFFAGFPAPAAPKANVTITGYATRNDAQNKTNPAKDLTVVLKQGEMEQGTYTTGANGQLLKDGNPVGALKLEAGEYTCSVSGTNTPNDVKFTVTEDQANSGASVEVAVYTLGSDESAPQNYDIGLTDSDMLGKAVADGTKVTVTIGGETQECVVSNGKISVQALRNDKAQSVKIAAEGYQEVNQDITFDTAARAVTVADVVLEQTRTTIELNVPMEDGGPAFVVVDKKDGGKVTDKMAMELPMTVKADASGKVTLELPDGDYTYTIQTPGAEEVNKDLTVENTGLQNGGTTTGKVTISDPDEPSKKTELEVPADNSNTVTANPGTTVTGDENASGDDAALPKIEDRLYSVVGEWTDTGMDVKVYLMNTNASTGTFGMTFDTSLFKTNDVTVNLNHIRYINESLGTSTTTNDLLMGGASGTALKNPINENGNLLFAWTADGGNSIDATSGKELIASFSLAFADGVDKDNFENKVTDTTLDSLDFANNTASWNNEINTFYAGSANTAKTFAEKYWRHVDGQNDMDPVPVNRLESSKALYAGFYQTYSADAENDDADQSLAVPQDTRQQFVFQTFSGAKKLEFEVKDPAGDPVPGATVTVTDPDGNPVGTGTTDTNGKVSITIPEDTDVKYEVEKDGYKPGTGTVPVADQEKVVEVTLTPDMSHKVKIHDDQQTKVKLVGGDAYNGADYLFTLEAQPGYTWPSGNMPAGNELTIKMTETGTNTEFTASTQTLTAVWNGTLNKYVISKDQLNFSDPGTIVIKITDPSDEPVEETTGYTVTVTSGEHGKFSYDADGNGSTFVPSGTTTGLTGTLVETLTPNTGTTSAKYSFVGDGPIDAANAALKAANQQYEAWVIYSMSVNGTEVTLSDYQKINGVVDYQINGIDRNQTITVTYGQATVEGDVIIDGPEPDPTSDANVTVILSAYGDAAVNSGTAWDGPDTKTYALAPGNFSAVFTGKTNVTQPQGDPVSYEIDTVTVDGVQVNVAGNSKWTAGTDNTSGTLAFLLSGGENYTVVVTFKPVGEDPIFAQLEVVNRTGHGSTQPDGISVRDVGLPVGIKVEADTGYKLSGLDLTEPGSAMQDVTPTDDPVANPYTYTTPALKAGTTTVGASFVSDATTYKVQVDVKYASVLAGAAVKAVNITFTDTDGNQIAYGPSKTGDYQLQNPTAEQVEYQLEIPAGTYNVTVSKKGYLTYTITGFKIGADGTSAGSADDTVAAEVAGGIIYFGQKDGEADTTRKAIEIVLGDATWDGNLIALDDIAQVANGLLNGAKAGQKTRANLTEKTGNNPTAVDMSYVINNYGKRSTNQSYVDFMK